jgi:hypothetical protein
MGNNMTTNGCACVVFHHASILKQQFVAVNDIANIADGMQFQYGDVYEFKAREQVI